MDVKYDLGVNKYIVLGDGRVLTEGDTINFANTTTGAIYEKAHILKVEAKSNKNGETAWFICFTELEPKIETKHHLEDVVNLEFETSNITIHTTLSYDELESDEEEEDIDDNDL